MDCPKCGTADSKPVELLLSFSYLCVNPTCDYYDPVYAYGHAAEALNDSLDFEWEYMLPDGTFVLKDDLYNDGDMFLPDD